MTGRFPGSGFSSEASVSGAAPATPPCTPARKQKRRLERSDSPSSIHPYETSSPAKKAAKRVAGDHVRVEELVEGDLGYQTDLDIVYPEELEEAASSSDMNGETTESDHSESEAGLSRHLSRLRCKDDGKESERRRRERHAARRQSSRLFKRSHSQSVTTDVKSEAELTDPDVLPDQDLEGSRRRLRRRVRGPDNGGPRSSPGMAGTGSEASRSRHSSRAQEVKASESDVMDVDGEGDRSGGMPD